VQIPRRALFGGEINTNICIGVHMESSEDGVACYTSLSFLIVCSLITSRALLPLNSVESNSIVMKCILEVTHTCSYQ
jgi:hypothetical protein